MSGIDAPTEADSERNGFLSYAGEWHAVALGGSAGASSAITGNPEIAAAVLGVAILGSGVESLKRKIQGRFAVEEITSEPWYAGGATIIAWVGATFLTQAGVV